MSADRCQEGVAVEGVEAPVRPCGHGRGAGDVPQQCDLAEHVAGRKGRRETSATRFDTDRDGLSDGVERGLTRRIADPPGPVKGTGRRFRRDRHPRSKTNPLRADTDHGGVLDGREDKNHNGRVDRGETDPTEAGDRPPRRRP